MKKVRLVAAMVLAGCGVLVVAQQKLDVELQLAIQREVASGDLKAAIVEYRRIAERSERSDRAVASRALLRLAEAHAKLGQAEARGIYERLVRDFGDQHESPVARARLQSAASAALPPTPSQPAARRLWNGRPSSAIDSVSYDGRYAILSTEDEGTGEAPVFDMTSGAVRRLGNKSPSPASLDYVETGAFSRDDTLVAYTRHNGEANRYEVWIANVTGDPNPRALFLNQEREFSYLRVTDWSPDKTRIAVQFSRGAANGGTHGIGFISVPDGTLRELKPLHWEWSPFTFSPDGRRMAGTVTPDGRPRISTTLEQQGEVFVLSADGGDIEVIAPHPAIDTFAGWSPDGSMLLFVSDRGGSDALWAIRFAAGHPQGAAFEVRARFSGGVIGMTGSGALYYRMRSDSSSDVFVAGFDFSTGRRTSEPQQISGIGQNIQTAWSPDGRLAYLNRRRDRIDLVVYSPDTSTREVARNVGLLAQLTWSPDSRFIFADRRGAGGGIFRIDVQSGEITREVIKPDGGELIQPSLSPDGKTLYFYHQLWGGETGVILKSKNLASGNERELIRITGTRGAGLARVSPDATKVYYRRTYPDAGPGVVSVSNQANEHAIVERNLQSGIERELIHRGTPQLRQTLGAVNLSPDGRYIATASTDVAARTVTMLLVPIQSGDVRELMKVTQPAGLSFSAWAPDSRSLLLTRGGGPGQPGEGWWIPLDGREPKKVDFEVRGLDVSPVGRHFAFTIAAPSQPVETWVLEHFLPVTLPRR